MPKRKKWTDKQLTHLQNILSRQKGRNFDKIRNQPHMNNVTDNNLIHAIYYYKMNVNHYWTEDEDDFIKNKVKEGLTYIQIAELMPNRSIEAVRHRAQRAGLCERRKLWNEEEDRELRAYSQLFTTQEIAERINRPYSSVHRRLKDLNLTPVSGFERRRQKLGRKTMDK